MNVRRLCVRCRVENHSPTHCTEPTTFRWLLNQRQHPTLPPPVPLPPQLCSNIIEYMYENFCTMLFNNSLPLWPCYTTICPPPPTPNKTLSNVSGVVRWRLTIIITPSHGWTFLPGHLNDPGILCVSNLAGRGNIWSLALSVSNYFVQFSLKQSENTSLLRDKSIDCKNVMIKQVNSSSSAHTHSQRNGKKNKFLIRSAGIEERGKQSSSKWNASKKIDRLHKKWRSEDCS